jgi:tetratricopeptide (TPR) repeat protein
MTAHAMLAAWQTGRADEIEAALAAWVTAGGETQAEYWVQRVCADSYFEHDTLARSVKRAENVARRLDDEIALSRIAAAVIDALYSDWLPSREARKWLDVLRAVTFARLHTLPVAHRLEIAAGILAAELFGEALSSATQIAESVCDWVIEGVEVPAMVRGNALGYALEYFSGQRRWQVAHGLAQQIDLLYREPGFGAAGRARISSRRGFYFHYRRGDYSGALLHSNEAVAQAKIACLLRPEREASITATLCHLMRGELAAAEHALALEAAGIPEGHLMMRANVHYERSWLHALRRDVVAAQRELDAACRLFAEIDEHGVMSLATPSLQAQLLLQIGEFDAALNVFEKRARRPDAWVVDIALIEAIQNISRGEMSAASAALQRGLAVAARIDIKGLLWACRPEFAQLLGLAAREHIEPKWVHAAAASRLIALT